MSYYKKKSKTFFQDLLNFYCFVNNETIPVPLWFGNTSENKFYDILRRVTEVCETDRFSDNVVLASGNFIKNDVIDILFEPTDE